MSGRKLMIERRDENERTRLALKGIIDEDADLRRLFSSLKNEVLMDLEGVELINSAGVREWVNAMAKLPSGTPLTLEKCSPRIVEQINYVSSFLGHGKVKSFFAPYFCSKCKAERSVLLEVALLPRKNGHSAPAQKCPKCGGTLEFDDVEEEYFAFLKMSR